MNICKWKNLEAFFIAVKHPTFDEQKESKKQMFFRNGVTFVTSISEFVVFEEVVFRILHLCGWSHNDEPYFNMVA